MEESKVKIFEYILYIFFAIFIIRLFYLQIIKGGDYERKSLQNVVKEIKIPALRGRILDRHGKILASWRAGYEAFIDDTILIEDIPIEEVVKIEESGKKIYVRGRPYRFYPYRSIYAQTIGWTGKASKEEILRGEYSLGDRVGKSGLEKIYEKFLRGKDGFSFKLMDAKGNILEEEIRPPILPKKGVDIVTTLDVSLGIYIDSLFSSYDKGTCIVINLKNGEILALYSKPSFDLNFLSGKVNEDIWTKIKTDTSNPLLNRGISGLYPPGSIFKVFTALVALELGLVDTGEVIFCKGEYLFGKRVFRDWKKEGHGNVNFKKAIEVSCDVYFYEIARRIGLKRFLEMLNSSGIEKKKCFDVFGEREGYLPDMEFYFERYGKYGFSEGNVLNLAIGQGEILLTPMQIAVLIGEIAGEGKIIKPHIIKKIGDDEVKVRDTLFLNFNKENIKIVKNALYYVCNGENGTGRLASIKGWKVAGKTGTSQNPFGKDHALFCGFAPFEDPLFLVMVVVENAGMGGEIAAPLAGKIFEYLYKKWQIGLLP